MTIEFRCQSCEKLLRTTDDKAGATAKCPDCGSPVKVPEPEVEDYDDGGSVVEDDYGAEAEGYEVREPKRSRYGSSAPSAGSRSTATKPCPMCGEEIRAAAIRCRYCGEDIDDDDYGGSSRSRRTHSTKIEAGEVISSSWEIFKSNMGLAIGGYLVSGLLNLVAMVICMVPLFAIISITVDRRGQPNPAGVIIGYAVFIVMFTLISTYLQAGQLLFLLNLVRGNNPEIGNLFAGGPYYLKLLGNGIIVSLIVGLGSMLCYVPGILLLLMLWPYQFIIIDESPPGLGSLGRAKEITEGNWGGVFLLGLAAVGFALLGYIACGVGLIFAAPLIAIMFGVAYCRMTGQRTVE